MRIGLRFLIAAILAVLPQAPSLAQSLPLVDCVASSTCGRLLGSGSNQNISAHGTCRNVMNTDPHGRALFIPHRMESEWQEGYDNSFLRNHSPDLVAVRSCQVQDAVVATTSNLTRFNCNAGFEIWHGQEDDGESVSVNINSPEARTCMTHVGTGAVYLGGSGPGPSPRPMGRRGVPNWPGPATVNLGSSVHIGGVNPRTAARQRCIETRADAVRIHWNLMRVHTTISSTEVERSIARVYQCVY